MKNKKRFLLTSAVCAVLIAGSCTTFSFWVGSYPLRFSALHILFPLVSSFFPLWAGSLLVSSIMILKATSMITAGVPSLIALATWKSFERKGVGMQALLSVVLPLSCMALFLAHPVGAHASSYSLYWLLPVLGFVVATNSAGALRLAAMSVSTTMVAHAVGSLMWLYIMPTTAVFWMALIPLVAVERLVFASGIFGVALVLNWLSQEQLSLSSLPELLRDEE